MNSIPLLILLAALQQAMPLELLQPETPARVEPIFGRVVDPEGEPVPGASVSARFRLLRCPRGCAESAEELRFLVQADDAGRFRVPPADHAEWGAGLPLGPVELASGGASLVYSPDCGVERAVLVRPAAPALGLTLGRF